VTVSCSGCGLYRNDPLPDSESLRRFHAAEYRESYKGVRTPKARNVYRSACLARHRLEQIGHRLPLGARILDVGSGSGEWLAALQGAGHQVSGVEPDPHYGEYARRQYGVMVETAGILDLERPPESLDAITLFHVLEHLPDPLAVLERFRGWLGPGGLLILEVPNTNCVHQNPAGRFHAAHVIGFTRESLAYALQLGGWERITFTVGERDRNLLAIVRKAGAGGPGHGALAQIPPPLVNSAAATAAYYLRPATYGRFLARMIRLAGEWMAVRRGVTPHEVLGLVQNSRRRTS
jgi:SAM-dependent methyltransferase